MTPDFKTPSVSSLVQAKLSLKMIGAIDLNATCEGFVYGLHMENALIISGLYKKNLVIDTETLSKITDSKDRNTCILFGDSGGVALVEFDELYPSFISFHLNSEGKKAKSLYCSNLSQYMFEDEIIYNNKIIQNGRKVYKWAVSSVPKGMKNVVQNASIYIS